MKRTMLIVVLVMLIALFAVVPAFAIVDPVTPICQGNASSGEAAGGAASGGNSAGSPVGPAFPAQGLAKSGTNACP